MNKTMRIALGAISHEANTFSPHRTDWADFKAQRLCYGPELFEGLAGTATEESGVLSVLEQTPECVIAPLLAAKALSGGPVAQEVFCTLLDELLARLRSAMPLDGVLLVLHGAMMAEGEPDATGYVLQAVRQVVGPSVPIVGTLDLHANVTERMVREATALVGYHTAPHIDLFETGQTAARLLVATLRGECKPVMSLARLPLLLPPENARHTEGPLAEVLGVVRQVEAQGSVLHAAIYPVQPWLDTADVGCAVVVVTDGDADAARRAAARLAGELWSRRRAFVSDLVPPEEAVRRAFARTSGLVVFCDSADSPTSGSTGDSTVILETLLRVAPVEQTVLLNIVDPDVVGQAIAAGVGAEVTLEVGGKLAPAFFKPVSFGGTVKLISDGVFRFKGPGMRGVVHRMGHTVVLVQSGLHLVVMERTVSQWDPQLYRSLGLEPSDARIVQVKSPAAFRAAYGPLAAEILIIASPGIATPQLATLPWRELRRPIYPLDPDLSWSA